MKTRGYVRITSFMAVGLGILIATSVANTRNMNYYKNELEVGYRHSLSELAECLSTVNTDLNKCLYSNSSSQQQRLSRDLLANCTSAKNAISRLPVSQLELGNTYKFLSQAGDYAQYIENKLRNGNPITEQEHKNLKVLFEYSERFSKSASDMLKIVSSGSRITDGSVKSSTKLSYTPVSGGFNDSVKSFESFPTLLYDGPFSDRVLNKKSALLNDSEIKTREECKAVAAKALSVNPNRVSYDSDELSLLPCYVFKSGRYTVSVTKQGGYVKSILYSGVISRSDISPENAVNLAKKYLDSIGYKYMKESYYSVNNNICTVNFAYAKNNLYVYSDLIKVGISMADGKIVSLDSATYLTNHTGNKTFKDAKSPTVAQKKLSPYVSVNGVKKCVIPKEDGKEVQCWEFLCTSADTGEDTLIYLNAKTLEEEDIMLLLYTDGGTICE